MLDECCQNAAWDWQRFGQNQSGMTDADDRHASLLLKFRGLPPLLHSIHFSRPPYTDKVTDLQNRELPSAVAIALLIFHTSRDAKLFRIRTHKPARTLVHTILNAKHQTRGRSCIRDLADGAFLKLFFKPPTAEGSYIEIDLRRLRPTSIEVNHDGHVIHDSQVLRQMAATIATQTGWDINDYSFETTLEESRSQTLRPQALNHTAPVPVSGEQAAEPVILDNPGFVAIHHAIRNFCQDGIHEHLRVGHIRSCGELHDLWAIDSDAYGQASITYEKFEDWWRSYPPGLWAIFFRTRVMGAIGIWPLSTSCASLLKAARLKESEITGRQMRVFREAPSRYWYVSGIVLRPELIGGRAIRILMSHGVGSWLSTANIKFPYELLALASSKDGHALLEGFNFFKVQNATMMPDRVPLFGLELADKQQLVSLLRHRGIEIGRLA